MTFFNQKAYHTIQESTTQQSSPTPKHKQATKMPLTILPATQPDIPTLVHIELEAFKSHPRIPMLWPNGYTPDLYAFYSSKKLSSLQDPNTHLLKAIDTEHPELILGAAEVTYALDPAVNAAQTAPDSNEQPPANWPKGGNWEMRRWFSGNTYRLVKEAFVDRWEGYIRTYRNLPSYLTHFPSL